MRKVIYSTVLVLALLSCSKDELKTDGELIGEKLEQCTKDGGVYYATTYFIHYGTGSQYVATNDYQQFFEIDGSVIKVGSTYYNLSQLVRYEIKVEDGRTVLMLYFGGYSD